MVILHLEFPIPLHWKFQDSVLLHDSKDLGFWQVKIYSGKIQLCGFSPTIFNPNSAESEKIVKF